jgi:hypothetical protein
MSYEWTVTHLVRAYNGARLTTIRQVKTFFKEMKRAGIVFHPDDDFTYFSDMTHEQAKVLNSIMEDCWIVCQKWYGVGDHVEYDIYSLAMDIQWPDRKKAVQQ